MIKFDVKIQLGDIEGKIQKRAKKTQVVLDTQILKDTNTFVPQDTGELIRSAIRMSLIGQGRLIWATPYARRLYYNPQYHFSKSPNPKAQGLWFEAAKAVYLGDWVALAAKEMGGRPQR
ncbi:1-phosphatidylinositol phosphodiesterase [Exiguobacterium sp. 8H]|uniref:minor capsid protein n=1 Tax=unclassified Exiguobacterium TaxID=2644629 RepID=UPI0012EF7B26|nr:MULTISPECIES: minor capsid protein [unclassified Exiguobacterium]VXB51721.1 1-phosphatidylinositol phosphodiesterase [Exiguobacterium sp. 8A]VXB52374.1 1-phosphatidylinositol phosphodiesterase [Exiguobacterium sp. 8H]